MSSSEGKYYEDLADFFNLCRLLKKKCKKLFSYNKLEKMKKHKNIEFRNFQYQLKDVND